MAICEICSKSVLDMKDIEECDTCGSLVCVSCVIDADSGLDVYCSEECKD